MAGRRSLVRKDLRWHAEESTTTRLSRGITDQLGKSLETRPFAVQRPATLQDRIETPCAPKLIAEKLPIRDVRNPVAIRLSEVNRTWRKAAQFDSG